MRPLLFAIALLAVAGAATELSQGGSGRVAPARRSFCGVERWSVKTLTDQAAGAVNRKPKTTTVAALTRLRAPTHLGRRVRGVETTTYRLRASLVEMKIEDDGDVHLVVAQPGTGKAVTMIAEFPSSGCIRKSPTWARKRMLGARAAVTKACGAPGTSFTALNGAATLTGVGFFDFIHGQAGVAPNGIELHPVVGISRISCKRAAPPPPSPPPTTVAPPPPPPPPPTTTATTTTTPAANCAPSYPDVCIPPPPPDLDCKDIPYRNVRVVYNVPDPDPHRFDGDHAGVGCES
jgi:hypothetical protein